MSSTSSIEPVFRNIRDRIADELIQAKHNIWIAVAWITDPALFQVLENKVREGVNVELVIADLESQRSIIKSSNSVLPFHKLIELGAKVFYMNSYYQQLMHHKFAVLDTKTVITGSYNWTITASKYNFENIVIIKNNEVVADEFAEEFKKLKTSINQSSSLNNWKDVLYIHGIKELSNSIEIQLNDGWYDRGDENGGVANLYRDSSSFQKQLIKKSYEFESPFYLSINLSVAVKKAINPIVNRGNDVKGEYNIVDFSPPLVSVKVFDSSSAITDWSHIGEPEISCQTLVVSDGRNYGQIDLIDCDKEINIGDTLYGQFSGYPSGSYKGLPTNYFVTIDEEISPYQAIPIFEREIKPARS